MPVVVVTEPRRRAGTRVSRYLTDAGWDVVRWPNEVDHVDAVVHVAGEHLAFAVDGSDPVTEELVGLGAVLIVYLAPPSWDAAVTEAWCAARKVEMVVLDATAKVHDLAPAVTAAVAG